MPFKLYIHPPTLQADSDYIQGGGKMDFKGYLKTMVDEDASDLYLSSGAPVSAKMNGTLTPLENAPLSPDQVKDVAYSVMDAEQITDFEKKPEMNLAISEEGIGRFRVNIFRQRNSISMVIRNIKTAIPDWKLLGLPPVLTDVIMEKRGLVLFVGATGSGIVPTDSGQVDHVYGNLLLDGEGDTNTIIFDDSEEDEHWDDLHGNVGEVVPARVAQHPPERDLSVAQHGAHLQAVRGREGSTDDDRMGIGHLGSSSGLNRRRRSGRA